MKDGPRLKTVLVENFRSINRKIEVRLDAPVVLIHGRNGTGKTSLLSAIEFTLTGAVPSLARVDPDYKTELLHYGATQGRVVLDVQGVDSISDPIEVRLSSKEVTATGKLGEQNASFFSERCYLAQSLLGQLLTIYQDADAGVNSPLSRFVHELLGLDRLDAIELGLRPGHDLRNARRLAPTYEDVERERNRLIRDMDDARTQLAEIDAVVERGKVALQNALAVLKIEALASVTEPSVLEQALRSGDEESALVDLADKSRQLIALRRQLGRLVDSASSTESGALEAAHSKSQSELAAWRERQSLEIDSALATVRSLFPGAELPGVSDPARAVAVAMALVTPELERCDAIAAREEADAKRRVELEDALVRVRSRIETLDKEIGSVAAEAGALSAALSELLPHIHSDDCPVCGRDYREVSAEPLSVRVAARAAELSDQAERLGVLTRERNALERERIACDRENETLVARALAPQVRLDIQDRRAKLHEMAASLTRLESPAARGNDLITAELIARRSLASLRALSGEEEMLRLSIAEQAISLGLAAPQMTESLGATLDRLEEHVRQEELRLKSLVEARNAALRELEGLNAQSARAAQLRKTNARNEELKERVTAAFNTAERIRTDVRRIATAASTTRASIVGRVFNDRLNHLWRDLFVRLAPAEAFVPAFRVPATRQNRLVPMLETRHRSGRTGGTPGAMLSSANLNTAALTLFLALHLSVKRQLPWLILDDPVQSMDEVHITQFAALLRTLAKEQHRQVIIAVHDRQLYDYLSVELSPASSGDELITIEIGMSAKGRTRCATRRHSFEPDTALKPIAA